MTRVGIGIGAFALTGPALRALGFDDASPAAIAMARLAGGRDIALGLHALSVRDEPEALRRATAITTAVDAGDAIAFVALGRQRGLDRATVLNAGLAGGAVVAGSWVSSRLRRR